MAKKTRKELQNVPKMSDPQMLAEFRQQTGLDSLLRKLPDGGKRGRSGGFTTDMAQRLANDLWDESQNEGTGGWRKLDPEMLRAAEMIVDRFYSDGHYGDVSVGSLGGQSTLLFKPADTPNAQVTLIATAEDRQTVMTAGSVYKGGVRAKQAPLDSAARRPVFNNDGSPRLDRSGKPVTVSAATYTPETAVACAYYGVYGDIPSVELHVAGDDRVRRAPAFVMRGAGITMSPDAVADGRKLGEFTAVGSAGAARQNGNETAASRRDSNLNGNSTPVASSRVISMDVTQPGGALGDASLDRALGSALTGRPLPNGAIPTIGVRGGTKIVTYNESHRRDYYIDPSDSDVAMGRIAMLHGNARDNFRTMFDEQTMLELAAAHSENPMEFTDFSQEDEYVAKAQREWWRAYHAKDEAGNPIPMDPDFLDRQLDQIFGEGQGVTGDGQERFQFDADMVTRFASKGASETTTRELQACVTCVQRAHELGLRDNPNFDFYLSQEAAQDRDRQFNRTRFIDGTVHFDVRDVPPVDTVPRTVSRNGRDVTYEAPAQVFGEPDENGRRGMNLSRAKGETEAEQAARLQEAGVSEFWVHKAVLMSNQLRDLGVQDTTVQVGRNGVVSYNGVMPSQKTSQSKDAPGTVPIHGEIGQIFEPDFRETVDGKPNPLKGSITTAYPGSEPMLTFTGYTGTVTPLRTGAEIAAMQADYDARSAEAARLGRPAPELPAELEPVPLRADLPDDHPDNCMIPRGLGNYVQRTKVKGIVQAQDEAIVAAMSQGVASGQSEFDSPDGMNYVYRKGGNRYPVDIVEQYRERGMDEETIYANLQTRARTITYASDITKNAKLSSFTDFTRTLERARGQVAVVAADTSLSMAEKAERTTQIMENAGGWSYQRNVVGSYNPEELAERGPDGRLHYTPNPDLKPTVGTVTPQNVSVLSASQLAGLTSVTVTNTAKSTGNSLAIATGSRVMDSGYVSRSYNPDGTPQTRTLCEETMSTMGQMYNNPDRNQMGNANIAVQQRTDSGKHYTVMPVISADGPVLDEDGKPVLQDIPAELTHEGFIQKYCDERGGMTTDLYNEAQQAYINAARESRQRVNDYEQAGRPHLSDEEVADLQRHLGLASGSLHGVAIIEAEAGCTTEDGVAICAYTAAEQGERRRQAALEAAANMPEGASPWENAYIQEQTSRMINNEGYGYNRDVRARLEAMSSGDAHPEWADMTPTAVAEQQVQLLNAFCEEYGYIHDRLDEVETHEHGSSETFRRTTTKQDKVMPPANANKGVLSGIADPERCIGEAAGKTGIEAFSDPDYQRVFAMANKQASLLFESDEAAEAASSAGGGAAHHKYRGYVSRFMTDAAETAQMNQLARDNPHARFVMSPYTASSRFNAGGAMEAMDTTALFKMLGEPVDVQINGKTVPNATMRTDMLWTDMMAETKSYVNNEHTSGGLNVSSQFAQCLAVKGAGAMLQDMFEPNTEALQTYREELITLGMDVTETGELTIGHKPHIVGTDADGKPIYEERPSFGPVVPEYSDIGELLKDVYRPGTKTSPTASTSIDFAAGVQKGLPYLESDIKFGVISNGGKGGFSQARTLAKPVLGRVDQFEMKEDGTPVRTANWHFDDAIPEQGGLMRLPFDIQQRTGMGLPSYQDANGKTVYELPVMKASLRQGRETVSGETDVHDYTQHYKNIWDAATSYEAYRMNKDFAEHIQSLYEQTKGADAEAARQATETLRGYHENGLLDTRTPAFGKDGSLRPEHFEPSGNNTQGRYQLAIANAQLHMDAQEAAAQAAYDSLAAEVAQRAIVQKDNHAKNLIKCKQGAVFTADNEATTSASGTISGNPELPIDMIRMSESYARELGLQRDKNGKWYSPGQLAAMQDDPSCAEDYARVTMTRNPLLSEGGIRYMRVEVVPDSDDPKLKMTGIEVNPYNMKSFEGDFDGDSVALYVMRTKEAHNEALAVFTMEAELVNREVAPDPKKGYPLNVNTGLGVATGVYLDAQEHPGDENNLENRFAAARQAANALPSDYRREDGSVDMESFRKASEVVAEVSSCITEASHKSFGHDINQYGNIEEHVQALMSQVRDSKTYCPKAKSVLQFQTYLNNCGYELFETKDDEGRGTGNYELVREGFEAERDPDGRIIRITKNGPADAKPMRSDEFKPPVEDAAAAFEAINAKAELTGTAGMFFQRASIVAISPSQKTMDMIEQRIASDKAAYGDMPQEYMDQCRKRGSYEKAATSLTHPVTQSVMQLKHDTSDVIRQKCKTIQDVLPLVWEGKPVQPMMTVADKDGNSKQVPVPLERVYTGDGDTPNGMVSPKQITGWQAVEGKDVGNLRPADFIKQMQAYYASPGGLNVDPPPKQDIQVMAALFTDAQTGTVHGYSSTNIHDYSQRLSVESGLQRLEFAANVDTVIAAAADHMSIYGEPGTMMYRVAPKAVKSNISEMAQYRETGKVPEFQPFDGVATPQDEAEGKATFQSKHTAAMGGPAAASHTSMYGSVSAEAGKAHWERVVQDDLDGRLSREAELIKDASYRVGGQNGPRTLTSAIQQEQQAQAIQALNQQRAAQAAAEAPIAPPPTASTPVQSAPSRTAMQLQVPADAPADQRRAAARTLISTNLPGFQEIAGANGGVFRDDQIKGDRVAALMDSSYVSVSKAQEIRQCGPDIEAKSRVIHDAILESSGDEARAAAAGSYYKQALVQYARSIQDVANSGQFDRTAMAKQYPDAAAMMDAVNGYKAALADSNGTDAEQRMQATRERMYRDFSAALTSAKSARLDRGVQTMQTDVDGIQRQVPQGPQGAGYPGT